MGSKSAPRESATLLTLAIHPERQTLMVAMLQRARSSRVMPGALVFPGGGVEEIDAAVNAELDAEPSEQRGGRAVRYAAHERAHIQRAVQDYEAWGFKHKSDALSSLRAALRETEEEADLSRPTLLRDARVLRCIGRWLTPEALKRRFDTYFWMIALDTPGGLP